MQSKPACQTLSKALDVSSATAQVAPHLLKALAILSDTTVRRSPVDREDLKPYLISEKRPVDLLAVDLLAVDLFPTFLNTGIPNETCQSGETRLFQTHTEEYS